MNAPTRPVLRWHGGKFLLADWIIGFFPPHRTYTEVFGGAASVLMAKPRTAAEIYNDLDDEVVGLFRVLQDPEQSSRLHELLRLTPFARREFEISYDPSADPVERARRLVIRSFMGFGSNAHASAKRGHRSTGFRSNSNRSGTTPAQDWANYPDALPAMVDRLGGVVIEHRDALVVLVRHDSETTLHYVDPPYVHETRSDEHMYRHELDGGGARQAARHRSEACGLCRSLRLSVGPLRLRPEGLAPRHQRDLRRWRPPPHRSSLDQSPLRSSSRPDACRRRLTSVCEGC
jgi:DNA adenine methylase